MQALIAGGRGAGQPGTVAGERGRTAGAATTAESQVRHFGGAGPGDGDFCSRLGYREFPGPVLADGEIFFAEPLPPAALQLARD